MNRAFIHAYAGHLLLSIAAFLLVVQTAVLHPDSTISIALKITIGFSTFFIYRLAYYGLQWPLNISTLLKKEIIASLLILASMIPLLKMNELAGLLLMLAGCLAYFMEYKNWKGMRSVPIVKNLWLATVWAIITVIIPLVDNMYAEMWMFFIERFLFLLPLCIIYNLRDNKVDSKNGIRTIPTAIGVIKTKIISLALLGINAYLIFIHHYVFAVSAALIISLVATAIVILVAKEDGHRLFYTFAVDATMILQSVLVIGAVCI